MTNSLSQQIVEPTRKNMVDMLFTYNVDLMYDITLSNTQYSDDSLSEQEIQKIITNMLHFKDKIATDTLLILNLNVTLE